MVFHYQYLAMLGLVLDLTGALFLAVEAIQIENFRKFRDHFLANAHRFTLSPVTSIPNSRLRDQHEASLRPSNSFPGLFMGLHYIAGLVLTLILNKLTDDRILLGYRALADKVLTFRWNYQIPVVLFLLLIIAPIIFWLLGECVHVLLTRILALSMKLIDFIDDNYPSGTIGIIGFLLLAVGFSLQFLSSFISF